MSEQKHWSDCPVHPSKPSSLLPCNCGGLPILENEAWLIDREKMTFPDESTIYNLISRGVLYVLDIESAVMTSLNEVYEILGGEDD